MIKKLLIITIAIMVMMSQEAICFQPMSKHTLRPVATANSHTMDTAETVNLIVQAANRIIQHVGQDGWVSSEYNEELLRKLQSFVKTPRIKLFADPERSSPIIMQVKGKAGSEWLDVNNHLLHGLPNCLVESILLHEMAHELLYQDRLLDEADMLEQKVIELVNSDPELILRKNEQGERLRNLIKRELALKVRSEFDVEIIRIEYQNRFASEQGYANFIDYLRILPEHPVIHNNVDTLEEIVDDKGGVDVEKLRFHIAHNLIPDSDKPWFFEIALLEGAVSEDDSEGFVDWMVSWLSNQAYCGVKSDNSDSVKAVFKKQRIKEKGGTKGSPPELYTPGLTGFQAILTAA